MNYTTYEIINNHQVDKYCINLSPIAVNRDIEFVHKITHILAYAKLEFNAESNGFRLFFNTEIARQEFLIYMILRES